MRAIPKEEGYIMNGVLKAVVYLEALEKWAEEAEKELKTIQGLFDDYQDTEICSCSGMDSHEKIGEQLAKILDL